MTDPPAHSPARLHRSGSGVAAQPADMRKGIDGLAELVLSRLGRAPSRLNLNIAVRGQGGAE